MIYILESVVCHVNYKLWLANAFYVLLGSGSAFWWVVHLYGMTKPTGSDKQYLVDKIRSNLPYFGKKLLKLNYIDKTKHTYVQSWTVMDIKLDNFWMRAVIIHLFITKYILKQGESYSFNTCS